MSTTKIMGSKIWALQPVKRTDRWRPNGDCDCDSDSAFDSDSDSDSDSNSDFDSPHVLGV